jgi:hypothetical protein
MSDTIKLILAIRALIQAMGMQSENEQRKHRGESMAYDARSFKRIIELERLTYNKLIK